MVHPLTMRRQRDDMDALRLLRPELRSLLEYEPIEPPELIAQRLGVAPEQVVKLDGNENPYGPSPRVVEALASFDGYHRYPDPQQRRLREALAAYVGVGPEHIVVGAGSDELIDLVLRGTVAPGEGVIDCPPTFGMYRFLTQVAGGRTIEVPRREDFSLDTDAVRQRAAEAKVVFVATPNNPTGNPLSHDELEALLATGLLVVLDEAYAEFGGASFVGLVPERSNLVVLRTFSKWAGLAGLRAGYGVFPAPLAEAMRRIKQPYSPSVAAEVAMLASLEDRALLEERVQAIVAERERLRRRLEGLGWFEVYPSEANFLLLRLRGGQIGTDGRAVRDALAQRGVFVRYFDTPGLRDCLRISVGLPEETDRLMEALQAIGGDRDG